MSTNLDRLYELLPTIYRLRDAEQGEPLRALLRVIGEQAERIEQDIGRLYENGFIETCDDWALPYLGDLIAYQPVASAGQPGDNATAQGRQLNKILMPRREIANTLGYRRRKGSLALLESLAGDVAGWPSLAVEFYPLLAWTQHVNHLRPHQGRGVDLRNSRALQRLGGAFDEAARSVDVRRLNSSRSPGRYNPAAVGLFVWRLEAYAVSKTSACCIEEVAPHCYTFSALGHDAPLYNRPAPDALAAPANVPAPIERRDLQAENAAEPVYYGIDKSFAIWAEGWPDKTSNALQPVPREAIISADLSGWRYHPPKGKLAVDPLLGRIAFPGKHLPKKVWVSYYYGFSADIGGGEYARTLSEPEDSEIIVVCGQEQLQKALEPWKAGQIPQNQPPRAVIEISDSGVYVLPINLELAAGHYLQIRAANRRRPIMRLLDWQCDQPDSLSVTGAEGSHFVLDGLLVTGRGLLIEGALGSVTLRHATLVPGWSLEPDCRPCRPSEPSVYVLNSQACVTLQHSITGSIQVCLDEVGAEPITLRISDSIVDAADCDGAAIAAPDAGFAHAALSIARSTVLGGVATHAVTLAENSIFTGHVCVARRQIGCLRFCYVPPESRTPRRFLCQPDEATKNLTGPARQREQLRLRPRFNGTRYGLPDYCQLAPSCAEEISRGAEDESEMGVFHDLYQPQRLAALLTRLRQYTPAGTDVGIILAS